MKSRVARCSLFGLVLLLGVSLTLVVGCGRAMMAQPKADDTMSSEDDGDKADPEEREADREVGAEDDGGE